MAIKQNNQLLKQMEMFDEMSVENLTPNQYYLLCCMKDSVTPLKINMHLELRNLLSTGWIKEDKTLAPKSYTLIGKIERLFVIQKTKTSNQLMNKGFKENIKLYREMFPNIKLPSNKPARSAVGNLEKAFRWFFENHSYTWPEIFNATKHYVNEQQDNNWKFTRTSQFFIRKNDLSDLADYCEMIKTDGFEEEKPNFKIKVV